MSEQGGVGEEGLTKAKKKREVKKENTKTVS